MSERIRRRVLKRLSEAKAPTTIDPVAEAQEMAEEFCLAAGHGQGCGRPSTCLCPCHDNKDVKPDPVDQAEENAQ